MEKLDESDIRACGAYLPLGRAGLAGGMVETQSGTGLGSGTLDQVENGTGLACGTLGQTENDTGLASGALEPEDSTGPASATLVEGSDDAALDFLEPAVEAGFGGVLPETGETASGESVTNEPNCHEDVKSSNYTTHIGITTNSDVDSGLDKGEIDHDFDGGVTDGGAECGEGFEVPRPHTPAVGEPNTTDCGDSFPVRRPPTPGVGEPNTTDCGDSFPVRRPPTAACGGTSPSRGEEELLAIETVKRQARAGPMADAIRDLLASSPEAMEVLKPFLPRGP